MFTSQIKTLFLDSNTIHLILAIMMQERNTSSLLSPITSNFLPLLYSYRTFPVLQLAKAGLLEKLLFSAKRGSIRNGWPFGSSIKFTFVLSAMVTIIGKVYLVWYVQGNGLEEMNLTQILLRLSVVEIDSTPVIIRCARAIK